MHICKKEIKETKYWIEMFAEVEPNKKEDLRKLWKEAHELTLIFGKISATLKN
ncbi:four helix bundle protein [Patescibacteria group bacterium]|nr:four helix bundle protein [Patescibacteria group bacterium]